MLSCCSMLMVAVHSTGIWQRQDPGCSLLARHLVTAVSLSLICATVAPSGLEVPTMP